MRGSEIQMPLHPAPCGVRSVQIKTVQICRHSNFAVTFVCVIHQGAELSDRNATQLYIASPKYYK